MEADLGLFRVLFYSALLRWEAWGTKNPQPEHTGVTPRRIRQKSRQPAWYLAKVSEATQEDAILNPMLRVQSKDWNKKSAGWSWGICL